jgi:hypothetical protein
MPLNTSIIRNGDLLKMPNGWGGFHVAAMVLAAAIDSGKGPFADNTANGIVKGDPIDYPTEPIGIAPSDSCGLCDYGVIAMTPLNNGNYILTSDHFFKDLADGEELHLLAGDTLVAYRD